MTVSSTTSQFRTTGNGITVIFGGPIKIFNETDILVQTLDNTTDAVVNTLILNDAGPLGYTVDFDTDAETLTITVNTAPLASEDIFVDRQLPRTQETDFPEATKFPAEANENGLDKLTLLIQDIEKLLNNTLSALASATVTNFTYVDVPIVGRGLKFSAVDGTMVNTDNDIDDIANLAAASAAAAAVSAGNAATSEANAAASEANAAASEASVEARLSAVALNWVFDAATGMADPSTGQLRLNNADITLVTQIAISSLTNETGNPDVSDFVATWDDSTNLTNRGTLSIRKEGDPSFFINYSVSGALTDNGTWLQLPITFIASNGSLSASDSLYVQFDRTGDKGIDGAGAGDLISTNNLADVADIDASRNNLQAAGVNVVNGFTRQQNFDQSTLIDGAAIAWNLDENQVTEVTLGGNRTLSNPTNQRAGATYILTVVQDGAGNRTLSFDTAYQFPAGVAPTLSTAAGAVDILTFVSNGTNMRGVIQNNFS